MNAPDPRSNAPARALWYVAPGQAELRAAQLPAPGPGEVLVRMLYSGLSRGTERLVFEGKVPASEYSRMRLPTQEGEFSFPVKYGYAAVGEVEAGPNELRGRAVFALHPHQSRFVMPAAGVVPLPDRLPPRQAVLSANAETALNILWDGEAAPGQRIAVVGAGLLGLLCAGLAAGIERVQVTVIDREPSRAALAAKMGAAFSRPEDAPRESDLVIHTSASDAGLALSLDIAAFEATIVEASWYGDRLVQVPLGGAFHSRRLRIVSSQVGAVAPSHRGRYTHRQRMEEAMRLLADDRFDALLGEEIPFDELPKHLPRLLASDAPGVGAYVRY
ncbi:MAG: dehydrogenase [Bradyrhizobiaceae bacterium]|nr:dehydrogenase [Bradyrhizobiaceae bacterium]